MTSERKGQNDVRGANEKKIIVYGEMLNEDDEDGEEEDDDDWN